VRPEEYWVAYGENVVGTDVLRDGSQARQAATYQAIVDWIIARGIEDVLDVGCNVAALAMFLRLSGYSGAYAGIDANPYALYIAEHSGEAVQIGNIRNLEYPDRSFQCVVVKDIIEHLESYDALVEPFRVARQYVVVGTYLPWTDGEPEITRHSDGYFANRYRSQDVIDLAAQCNFSLIQTLAVSEATGWPNQVTFWERNR
jgi:ubiquinone/menaquinone biosynthesis C-methylase UbiE